MSYDPERSQSYSVYDGLSRVDKMAKVVDYLKQFEEYLMEMKMHCDILSSGEEVTDKVYEKRLQSAEECLIGFFNWTRSVMRWWAPRMGSDFLGMQFYPVAEDALSIVRTYEHVIHCLEEMFYSETDLMYAYGTPGNRFLPGCFNYRVPAEHLPLDLTSMYFYQLDDGVSIFYQYYFAYFRVRYDGVIGLLYPYSSFPLAVDAEQVKKAEKNMKEKCACIMQFCCYYYLPLDVWKHIFSF